MLWLLILVLIILIISDFRCRYVYIWQLILFGILQFVYSFSILEATVIYWNLITNGIAILFISFLVGVYMCFRFRGRGCHVVGWGDIIFICMLTPYFPVAMFLWFMIVSLLFTLGGWLVGYVLGYQPKDIPLVSTLGVCYSIFLIYNSI